MTAPAYAEGTEMWFADEGEFRDQINTYWGDWGCASEVGTLRAVMLRRPGAEIEHVKDAKLWRWLDVMDPASPARSSIRWPIPIRQQGVAGRAR